MSAAVSFSLRCDRALGRIRPIVEIDGFLRIDVGNGLSAWVDIEDRGIVETFNWTAHRVSALKIYASRRDGKATILLHRVIMQAPKGMSVDHIDNDGLNNRRANLRLATNQQNRCNSPRIAPNQYGYRGVSKNHNKFYARVTANRKPITVGGFDTPEEAHAAYLDLVRKHHGAFAFDGSTVTSSESGRGTE